MGSGKHVLDSYVTLWYVVILLFTFTNLLLCGYPMQGG